eukprot:6202927-Pleurochrysis_carterae.AAC.3
MLVSAATKPASRQSDGRKKVGVSSSIVSQPIASKNENIQGACCMHQAALPVEAMLPTLLCRNLEERPPRNKEGDASSLSSR